MKLLHPKIIAPDSSHWAKWIDAALSGDRERRLQAQEFHARMLDSGRVPMLTWHHLEELLSIHDDASARDRIAFIQNLPLVAFLRLPFDSVGLGAITDVMAAETIAATEGAPDTIAVRDRAKNLLLKVGNGREAIGDEAWVWQVVRSEFRRRNADAKALVAIAGFQSFDANRTIGEISKGSIRPRQQFGAKAEQMRAALAAHIQMHGDPDIKDAEIVAGKFMDHVMALMPPPGATVRDLLIIALTAQGVDENEITDDRSLSELNELAIFRTKLRVIAEKCGVPFELLKSVQMERLPHWIIESSLKAHGQRRERSEGGDLNDGYLAALAAYTDEIYVDKRTAEDFRRAKQQSSQLAALIGEIRKAALYTDIG